MIVGKGVASSLQHVVSACSVNASSGCLECNVGQNAETIVYSLPWQACCGTARSPRRANVTAKLACRVRLAEGDCKTYAAECFTSAHSASIFEP